METPLEAASVMAHFTMNSSHEFDQLHISGLLEQRSDLFYLFRYRQIRQSL